MLLALTAAIVPAAVNAQIAFTNSNSRLVMPGFHSGCPVAVVDFNNDGKDDIVRLNDATDLYVEIQKTNNQFETHHLGNFGGGSGWAWAMCVADVDHNGYMDVLAGGGGSSVKVFMTDNNGTTGAFVNLPNSNFFLQNATFADFNNDGWIDVFCCDDNAESHIYLNDGSGVFNESTTTINFNVTGTDDSGNYGSVWTDFDNDGDFDLYIAKCRQGVNDPTDGRRINVMFENDGNGNFTETAANYNLNIGWQSWTASFGDIDNDGDMDLMVTNHDHESMIMENDGSGHFTDITAQTGFDITDITPIESAMEDFDNDGYSDILITGSDSRLWHNNGNGTFTLVENVFNSNAMESFAIGDLNHDGAIDIYASYATIYTNPTSIDDVVYLNNRTSNNFFTLDLKGTVSNHGAIGAKAKIYGSWGVQVREVKSGESYGTVNSAMLHFGLGQETAIDSVVISWPSGTQQTIVNPAINQFLTVTENICVSPEAIIDPSPSYICPGQSVTLTAPAGYDYLWSDGSTAQTLVVSQGGEYGVQVSIAGNNCTGTSATRVIVYNPDETPVITAVAETDFCDGGSVQLTGPAGLASYNWSNGEQTQTATITASGSITLTTQGVCGPWTSAPIVVTSHLVPDAVSSNVTITSGSTASLNATGTDLTWYDVPSGGTPLATGANFVTPVLTVTDTFYVDNSETYGGGVFGTGLTTHTGSSLYSAGTTSARMFFDVEKSCTLKTVTVITDSAAVRRIELRDNNNVVLYYTDIMINPGIQVLQLDFPLVKGTGYQLLTNDSVNDANLGYISPRLQRNNSGAVYPYTIPDALSITGNDVGPGYYYYFYNWQVEKWSLTCNSVNRIPVIVDVQPVGLNEVNHAGLSVYPNPASDQLNMTFNNGGTSASVTVIDPQGKTVIQRMVDVAAKKATVDISNLSQGIYILEVRQGETKWQRKITIM